MIVLGSDVNEIIFNEKPNAVPYNYRISYKIAQLCIIMSECCGRGGCSLYKLHMISMAMTSKKEKQKLEDFCNGKSSSYTVVRFDPAVNRAIKYALGDSIVTQQANGLFKLMEKGKRYVTLIKKDETIMINEKDFLKKISCNLTEDKIQELMKSWRYIDATNS